MLNLLRIFRNATFLLMFCGAMVTTAVAMGAWAFSLAAQVGTLSASAASAAFNNRKAIARAVIKTKAKARVRRVMVVVPFLGIAAAAAFESQDYLEWKKDNPDGTLEEYGCEIGTISLEVLDEVLQELPEKIRPSKETIANRLPKCNIAN